MSLRGTFQKRNSGLSNEPMGVFVRKTISVLQICRYKVNNDEMWVQYSLENYRKDSMK